MSTPAAIFLYLDFTRHDVKLTLARLQCKGYPVEHRAAIDTIFTGHDSGGPRCRTDLAYG